ETALHPWVRIRRTRDGRPVGHPRWNRDRGAHAGNREHAERMMIVEQRGVAAALADRHMLQLTKRGGVANVEERELQSLVPGKLSSIRGGRARQRILAESEQQAIGQRVQVIRESRDRERT